MSLMHIQDFIWNLYYYTQRKIREHGFLVNCNYNNLREKTGQPKPVFSHISNSDVWTEYWNKRSVAGIFPYLIHVRNMVI